MTATYKERRAAALTLARRYWERKAKSAYDALPIVAWYVSYYYLATGMEGNAASHSVGTFWAKTEKEALDQAVAQYKGDNRDKSFYRGCLTARKES